jgi:hypothetical protein
MRSWGFSFSRFSRNGVKLFRGTVFHVLERTGAKTETDHITNSEVVAVVSVVFDVLAGWYAQRVLRSTGGLGRTFSPDDQSGAERRVFLPSLRAYIATLLKVKCIRYEPV